MRRPGVSPGDEREAREGIDRLLTAAGWSVCDANQVNLSAARGVAIREFHLPGQGFADYLIGRTAMPSKQTLGFFYQHRARICR